MLYLAEVQKKTGFIGSGRTEFRLLAAQNGEQTWSSVSSNESIPAPDDASYNAGALVMVELSGSRQVQRHYEAGRPLVSILQGFSNLSRKFKTQEEEIEQWKQSLTFQSQELNRREMEIEARQEQIDQAEADLEQLQTQQQELEQEHQHLNQTQAELERKTQELEGAWAQLNGETRRLEEKRAALQASSLDKAQLEQLQSALQQLTAAVATPETLYEQLQLATEKIQQQEDFLHRSRQELASLEAELEGKQKEAASSKAALKQAWEQWHQEGDGLANQRGELKVQQRLIAVKQDKIQQLTEHLQNQSRLHQQLYDLLDSSSQIRFSKKVDVATLEAMSVEDLQALIDDLERDLTKVSKFVSDQEEELALQQQSIEQIRQQLEHADESSRAQLETELADEQDRCQMLNETLVGQRRNLVEREEILSQHKAFLHRKQDHEGDEATRISSPAVESLIDEIDNQRKYTNEAIQNLETEVKQMQDVSIAQKREFEQASQAHQEKRETILAQEAELDQLQMACSALDGRIQTRQAMLEAFGRSVEGIDTLFGNLSDVAVQIQESSSRQRRTISEMQQMATELADASKQHLAAS